MTSIVVASEPMYTWRMRRRAASRLAELILVIIVIAFSIVFWLLFAFQPKRLQLIGPDGRPVGKMSSKRVAMTSLVIAVFIALTVISLMSIARA
jgi:small-conductance mechanosensitive channel